VRLVRDGLLRYRILNLINGFKYFRVVISVWLGLKVQLRPDMVNGIPYMVGRVQRLQRNHWRPDGMDHPTSRRKAMEDTGFG
jgi:hypothetical protein